MYWTHQTLLRKSDKTLWILNPISDPGTTWDWGSTAIGNDKGEIAEMNYDDLTNLEDEFGEPVGGRPQKCTDHPTLHCDYLKPDMSLLCYIDMSEEEKARRRQKVIDEVMGDFDQQLTTVHDPSHSRYSPLSLRLKGSRYQRHYLEEAILARCDRHFDLRLVPNGTAIYVFQGVPFVRSQDHVFDRLERLDVGAIEAFSQYLKEIDYKPRTFVEKGQRQA